MPSENEPDRRLDRAAVAARLSERLGHAVSPRSVAELPIPFKVVFRKATSTVRDVDAFADAVLAGASVRVGGRSRRQRSAA